MRLLLALCLLAVLAGAAQGQQTTPQTDPPRDRVVPEGTEGLSAEEIYWKAVSAQRSGDLLRSLRLLQASAEAGYPYAALDLAALTYQIRAPGWAAKTLDYARLAAEGGADDSRSFLLMGLAGGASEPPIGDAQVDLWYTIAAWDLVDLDVLDRRAIQLALQDLREEFLNGALPERYESLVGELFELRRAGGDVVYKRMLRVCESALQHADRLCWRYLIASAERGHALAQYDLGIALLDEGKRLRSRELDAASAVRMLCRSATQGHFPALARLAALVLQDGRRPGWTLAWLAVALRDTRGSNEAAARKLHERLVAAFSQDDRFIYDHYAAEEAVPPAPC